MLLSGWLIGASQRPSPLDLLFSMSVLLVQEAAASGVKVTDAKRNLKLLQGLESAIKAGEGEAANVVQLRAKLDAALQAGVSSPLIEAARQQLQEALLGEVRCSILGVQLQHCDHAGLKRFRHEATLTLLLDILTDIGMHDKARYLHMQRCSCGSDSIC